MMIFHKMVLLVRGKSQVPPIFIGKSLCKGMNSKRVGFGGHPLSICQTVNKAACNNGSTIPNTQERRLSLINIKDIVQGHPSRKRQV